MPVVRSVDVAGLHVRDRREVVYHAAQTATGTSRTAAGHGRNPAIISVEANAPHNGEAHPDGHEFLHVISDRLRLISESDPTAPVILGPGDACIMSRGD